MSIESRLRELGLDPDGVDAMEARAFESFLRAHPGGPGEGVREEWEAYARGDISGRDVDWRDYHGWEGDDS